MANPKAPKRAKPTKAETKEALEWAAQARTYQSDGYNAAVVVRKMIQVHSMPERAAEVLVGGLYGKAVHVKSGDTHGQIMSGLVQVAVGLGGCFATFMFVGFAYLQVMFFVYAAFLALAGKGAYDAIIATMKADADALRKK